MLRNQTFVAIDLVFVPVLSLHFGTEQANVRQAWRYFRGVKNVNSQIAFFSDEHLYRIC